QCAYWTVAVIRPEIVLQVRPELLKRGVMKRLGCGVLDGPVHALNLAVGPGMEGLGQAMLNAVLVTKHIEGMLPVGLGSGLLGELDTVVGQDRMDVIWQGFQGALQEVDGGLSGHLLKQFGMDELGGAVDGDEQIGLSFGCPSLG